MLLQCEFQYNITQTVRLTNGSRRAECAVQSHPTAKWCPVNLSRSLPRPLSSNCNCWGCKLWPWAHIVATGLRITTTTQSGPVPLLLTSHEW